MAEETVSVVSDRIALRAVVTLVVLYLPLPEGNAAAMLRELLIKWLNVGGRHGGNIPPYGEIQE